MLLKNQEPVHTLHGVFVNIALSNARHESLSMSPELQTCVEPAPLNKVGLYSRMFPARADTATRLNLEGPRPTCLCHYCLSFCLAVVWSWAMAIVYFKAGWPCSWAIGNVGFPEKSVEPLASTVAGALLPCRALRLDDCETRDPKDAVCFMYGHTHTPISMYVCMYIYIHMYISIYIYFYIFTHTHMFTFVQIHLCIHFYVYIYTHV